MMRFLQRDQIETLFKNLPTDGAHALRDRALLLFLYNTGARVTGGCRVTRRQPRTGS